jgi:hypothetical protein
MITKAIIFKSANNNTTTPIDSISTNTYSFMLLLLCCWCCCRLDEVFNASFIVSRCDVFHFDLVGCPQAFEISIDEG